MCQNESISEQKPIAPDPVMFPPDLIELRSDARLAKTCAITVASIVFFLLGLICGFVSASF